MTSKEKIELIKKYAPVLWIHEDETFLPEDCGVMEEFAKVGKSDEDMHSFTLDELGELSDSKKYYMDIPEIDLSNFEHICGKIPSLLTRLTTLIKKPKITENIRYRDK